MTIKDQYPIFAADFWLFWNYITLKYIKIKLIIYIFEAKNTGKKKTLTIK